VASARAAIGDTHLVWGAWQLHDVVRLGHPELVSAQLAALSSRIEGTMVPTMARHALALESGDPIELERVASAFEAMGSYLFAAEAAAHAQRVYLTQRRPRLARVAGARTSMLAARAPGARTPPLAHATPVPLTARELEIASLAAEGLPSRAIAERLRISVRTVDNHLQSTYGKLGVRGRAELTTVLGVDRLGERAVRE
jgi:DNA-binding NarL/FixJ family response regulator